MDKIVPIAKNKRAFRAYELLDKLEAGIVLLGTEIKSIRSGNVSFRDSFVDFVDGETWLVGFYIAPYSAGNVWNHDASRKRKLLLNRREIRKWDLKTRERGLTVVPTEIYIKNGRAKMAVALARGKALFDKKEDLKERDIRRDEERLLNKYKYR